MYEVKALYSDDFFLTPESQNEYPKRIVARAWRQLRDSRVASDRRLGLFFIVYTNRNHDAARVTKFMTDARDAIQAHFKSDHDIRLTALCPLTVIDFGVAGHAQRWHTQSWITWGSPGNP